MAAVSGSCRRVTEMRDRPTARDGYTSRAGVRHTAAAVGRVATVVPPAMDVLLETDTVQLSPAPRRRPARGRLTGPARAVRLGSGLARGPPLEAGTTAGA